MKGGWYVVTMVIVATLTIVMADDTVITPIPTECPAKDSRNYTVHVAHESDCTKFYKCDHGKKVEMSCPLMNDKGDRLHFNPRLQVCDYPENAGCTSSTKEPSTVTPPTPTPSKPTPPTPTPTKPTPPTPTPTKPTPPTPTPTKPTPPTPTPTKPTPPTPTPTPSQPTCTEEGAGLPHECSCENYYICKNGNLVLRRCPDGLHWNVLAKKCDKAVNANCIKKKSLQWYY
ncbi:peritrophin-1-like [Vespula squamosa]|uniref:Peritrophin-1-like n=1 Tax=Vespula squamosa TaxID=30214 RepID=A0ABD2A5I1_VESSQ